ncbi:hypothetical protein [Woodsholea maritima]|uniref:hypothetical protein n=1 Tax=Woodsholea maritima TaxID=240237 RepID=UPI0003774753|nr:hypothetical protein [Woodsholea maritima]
MARDIDDKKKRKALAKLRRAKALITSGDDPTRAFSEWEEDFVTSLEDRLETFGSAFNDPEKGALDEPLSARQALKLKEIEKKAKGKAKGIDRPRYSSFKSKTSSFTSKSQPRRSYGRDIHDDVIEAVETPVLSEAQSALPQGAKKAVKKGFTPRLVVGDSAPHAPTPPAAPEPMAPPSPAPQATPDPRARFQIIAGGLDAKAS